MTLRNSCAKGVQKFWNICTCIQQRSKKIDFDLWSAFPGILRNQPAMLIIQVTHRFLKKSERTEQVERIVKEHVLLKRSLILGGKSKKKNNGTPKQTQSTKQSPVHPSNQNKLGQESKLAIARRSLRCCWFYDGTGVLVCGDGNWIDKV